MAGSGPVRSPKFVPWIVITHAVFAAQGDGVTRVTIGGSYKNRYAPVPLFGICSSSCTSPTPGPTAGATQLMELKPMSSRMVMLAQGRPPIHAVMVGKGKKFYHACVCMCVCVCVSERFQGKKRGCEVRAA